MRHSVDDLEGGWHEGGSRFGKSNNDEDEEIAIAPLRAVSAMSSGFEDSDEECGSGLIKGRHRRRATPFFDDLERAPKTKMKSWWCVVVVLYSSKD